MTPNKSYWVKIKNITTDFGLVIGLSEFEDNVKPEIGDEIVQFGSAANKSRQSLIYLHCDEGGQPTIDLLNCVNSKDLDGCIKVRIDDKGFYTENGEIKNIASDGSVINHFKKNGDFTLANGKLIFSDNKLTFGSDVVLGWSNLDQNVKDQISSGGSGGVAGEDGQDGATIEFIYFLSDSITPPNKPISSSVSVPVGWWGYPKSVTEIKPYLYISTRTVTGDTRSEYSDPALFTKYSVDGQDGDSVSCIYKRSNSITPPDKPTTETLSQWNTRPLGVSETMKYEFISTKQGDLDWSDPVLWSSFGADGRDGGGIEYIYKRSTTSSIPSKPTVSPNTDLYVPDSWTNNPSGVNSSYLYEFVSMRSKTIGGSWSAWCTPALWAKFGENGNDAELPDWLEDWNSGTTMIGSTKVLTPKIFAGSATGGILNGVAMGYQVYNNETGLFGFKNSTKTFSINNEGDVEITGKINSQSGSIAGFEISEGNIGIKQNLISPIKDGFGITKYDIYFHKYGSSNLSEGIVYQDFYKGTINTDLDSTKNAIIEAKVDSYNNDVLYGIKATTEGSNINSKAIYYKGNIEGYGGRACYNEYKSILPTDLNLMKVLSKSHSIILSNDYHIGAINLNLPIFSDNIESLTLRILDKCEGIINLIGSSSCKLYTGHNDISNSDQNSNGHISLGFGNYIELLYTQDRWTIINIQN